MNDTYKNSTEPSYKYTGTLKKKELYSKDTCDELFQIEMYNNDFINNWVSLSSIKPSRQETNCAPNVLFFLGILDHNNAQQLSYHTECDIKNPGMHLNEISIIVDAFQRKGIRVNMYIIPIERIFESFNLRLQKNHVTFFDIRREDNLGHALVIGKDNNNELVVFDPQQREMYMGENNIRNYLMNQKAIAFTTFCSKYQYKRKRNEIDSIIRKDKGDDVKVTKKQRLTGGKRKTKKFKRKMRKSKRKMRKSKRKTKKNNNRK